MEKKNSKILEMPQQREVDSEVLGDYLYEKIDFVLPDEIWAGINNGYAEFYNTLSSGDAFYGDEIFEYMVGYLYREKLMFPLDKLREIHQCIFEYLEQECFV